MGDSNFDADTCLELKQPDENYKNISELLSSFPPIKLYFSSNQTPYILYPHNYFYIEYPDEPKEGVDKICIALKGEEEGKIIFGAFSMIDHYIYFDWLNRKIWIYEENCQLKSTQLLKKWIRVLEEIFTHPIHK